MNVITKNEMECFILISLTVLFVVDCQPVDLVAGLPVLGPLPADLVQLDALLKSDPFQPFSTVEIVLKIF